MTNVVPAAGVTGDGPVELKTHLLAYAALGAGGGVRPSRFVSAACRLAIAILSCSLSGTRGETLAGFSCSMGFEGSGFLDGVGLKSVEGYRMRFQN